MATTIAFAASRFAFAKLSESQARFAAFGILGGQVHACEYTSKHAAVHALIFRLFRLQQRFDIQQHELVVVDLGRQRRDLIDVTLRAAGIHVARFARARQWQRR